MKRHPVLVPLSREHHDSLILAQLLKKDAPAYKGLPTDPSTKSVYALHKFNSVLKDHFAKEEAMLEKANHFHAEIQGLARDIIREHNVLAKLFLQLDQSSDLIGAMDTLGHLLEEHIRKEERILFPLIQKYVPEETLMTIA